MDGATTGTITIGGKVYPTISFGYLGDTYTFMTENLDLDVGEGCKYYDNDPSHAQPYGRLYTWEAANQAAPDGWSVIDYHGWNVLFNDLLDGFHSPSSKLAQGGDSGLNFQYGGRFDCNSKQFVDQGNIGCYWSGTAINAQKVCSHYLQSPAKGNGILGNIGDIDSVMLSVRFFKTSSFSPDDPTTDPTKKRSGFTYGSLVDNRPDKSEFEFTYRTIKLKDGKEWMAENFNFLLTIDKSLGCGNDYTDPAPQSRVGYGLYYTWDGIQGALPAGWRLPTVDEWKALIQAYGGANDAYQALLNGGTSGMDLQLLSWRAGAHFTMSGVGELGYFWSGSEGRDKKAAALLKLEKSSKTAEIEYLMKDRYYSVRLIKE